MPIPTTITLHGCEIQIKLIHNLYRDTGRYGGYNSCDLCIEIDATISEQKQEQIFFHEFLEAVKDFYLIDDQSLSDETIQRIAVSLYELLKTGQVDLNA